MSEYQQGCVVLAFWSTIAAVAINVGGLNDGGPWTVVLACALTVAGVAVGLALADRR